MPAKRDVFITGVGVVSALGNSFSDFSRAIYAGESGIRQLTGSVGQNLEIGFGGELINFDGRDYVRPRKALKVMARELQTAYATAMMAMQQANLEPHSYPADRLGTIFGSEMMSGEPEELADAMIDCGVRSNAPRVADFGESAMKMMFPLWMLKYLPNMAACHVGIALGALGPNNSLVLGDTSAAAALVESANVLERGWADCIISGAAGTKISPTRLMYRSDVQVPSRRNPIETSSRPMAVDRDGIVGGEGAACFVVESAVNALQRGGRPLAQLSGTAIRFVSSGHSDDHLQKAIFLAVTAALEEAGIDRSAVGLVISHAMGHPRIDQAEAMAIHQFFGDRVPVFAPISYLGHTGAASGAMGIAAALMALETKVIPSTLNAEHRDPKCPVNLTTGTQTLSTSHVLVLSHTAQGHVVALIFNAV
jgi:3-oxoacyl-[acyl-carrier-protein] synthase II